MDIDMERELGEIILDKDNLEYFFNKAIRYLDFLPIFLYILRGGAIVKKEEINYETAGVL